MADAKLLWRISNFLTLLFIRKIKVRNLVMVFISMIPHIKPAGVKVGLLVCYTFMDLLMKTIDHLSFIHWNNL